MTQEQANTVMNFARKLIGLGIKAQFVRLEEGPIVTGYYFTLDHSVPINKIINRDEDFALAAGAEKVTITRQGGEIVIHAANTTRTMVDFKDYLHWFLTDKKTNNMRIPIALGVDTVGVKQAIDLVECPHILLAGQTGSGKSVLQSAILCSLAVAKTPAELQIILVDSKRLDLPLFEELPHVRNVVKNLSEYQTTMEALFIEVASRTNTISGASCRNIKEFNNLIGYDKHRLPYILVMIDEFGDLVLQDREERKSGDKERRKEPTVEDKLKRLVQICRAVGIHVIAGTQRTSVEIIDGDIKTNLPTRISLRLPTQSDSRTILGVGGAEKLLGKGDMFIQRDDCETLKRYHGPFVAIDDIARTIEYQEMIRQQYQMMRK